MSAWSPTRKSPSMLLGVKRHSGGSSRGLVGDPSKIRRDVRSLGGDFPRMTRAALDRFGGSDRTANG
eukprot:154735-Prorocentrum_minimum.AAC.2